MEAPVITDNQLKRVLRKRKPTNTSIRNVLSKPNTLRWPEVTEEDGAEIFQKLGELISYETHGSVNWELIKNMPRGERRNIRNKLNENFPEMPKILKHIIFGVNAVARAVERKSVAFVLISSDINPRHIVKHTWYACNTTLIPVIVIPNLSLKMKQYIGIPAIVIAFKKIPRENPLFEIQQIVETLDGLYTGRTYPVVEVIDLVKTDSSNIELKKPKKKTINNSVIIPNDTVDNEVYIYRTTKERCFIPPRCSKPSNTILIDWSLDFIPFGQDMEEKPILQKPLKNTQFTSTPISHKAKKKLLPNRNQSPSKKTNDTQLKTKKSVAILTDKQSNTNDLKERTIYPLMPNEPSFSGNIFETKPAPQRMFTSPISNVDCANKSSTSSQNTVTNKLNTFDDEIRTLSKISLRQIQNASSTCNKQQPSKSSSLKSKSQKYSLSRFIEEIQSSNTNKKSDIDNKSLMKQRDVLNDHKNSDAQLQLHAKSIKSMEIDLNQPNTKWNSPKQKSPRKNAENRAQSNNTYSPLKIKRLKSNPNRVRGK